MSLRYMKVDLRFYVAHVICCSYLDCDGSGRCNLRINYAGMFEQKGNNLPLALIAKSKCSRWVPEDYEVKQHTPVEMQVKPQARNPSRINHLLAFVLMLSQVSVTFSIVFPAFFFPLLDRFLFYFFSTNSPGQVISSMSLALKKGKYLGLALTGLR